MDLSKYKELFLSECREKLLKVGNLVLSVEKKPQDDSIIQEIFREAHSIKGMAAAMGYKNISRLSHRIEDLFDRLRKKELSFHSGVLSVALKAQSQISSMLSSIEEEDSEGDYPGSLESELETVIKGETVAQKTRAENLPARAVGKDTYLKVKAGHLDRLIDIGFEFMSMKWRLKTLFADDSDTEHEIEAFDRLIKDLNQRVIAMRMMPIGVLTATLPRFVKESSMSMGKKAELEISGESIELDKTIIETLEPAVVHLIRNCIGHGIETPEEREKADKRGAGNIFFKAYRFQNKVVIEIGDDGRGIDANAIAMKAVKAGLLKEIDLKLMDREKKLLLICHPGLSTASKVDELSGRGVGMDVVKSAVESLGGHLAIFSEPGNGTTFKIELPLTTAMIKVFVVEVDNVRYGIPMADIERVDWVPKEEIKHERGNSFMEFGGSPRIGFRYLGRTLRNGKAEPKAFHVLIVRSGNERFAFGVDGLYGVEEVVVRPLSRMLKFIRGVSAVTVLPQGKPMFILNSSELI